MAVAVNRATASLATEMIAIFGDSAGAEAAARAERFRNIGIVLLATGTVQGTLQ
jgi:hypothetical protein